MIGRVARLSTFSALRHRDYRVFWGGSLVSLTGTWVQGTAQSYLVWELTRSPLATSLTVLFFSLPTTLVSLVGGVIADRVDRRRLLLITQTTFALQALALAILTFSGLIRVWQIYLLALINGTVMAFDAPGRQSMIPSLVAREDLSNAIALNSTAFNASRVVGPPLAGLIYATAGPAWCFAINAASFVAILYALWQIRPASESPAVHTDLWRDLREGLGYARQHAVVRTMLVLVALAGTFAFTYVVLMPVVANAVLGGGPRENGYLLGAAGIGATVGALAVASLRPGRPGRFIVASGYVGALALLALSLSRHLILSMVLTAGLAGSIMAFLNTCNATIQAHVPDALRGRIMSIYTLALIGSGPLNSVFAGTLGNWLGAPVAIALSGVLLGLTVAAVAMSNRSTVGHELDTRRDQREKRPLPAGSKQ